MKARYEVWICLLDRWLLRGRFNTQEEANAYVEHMKTQLDIRCEVRHWKPRGVPPDSGSQSDSE